jgi:2-polyprenyl-6-methoxyphenol hydroxylase-like FAD-dependent oxidoreductase
LKVLIGDAAATSDPTWGQGLSLTLRDARVLRDALLTEHDWNAAGHAYASVHGFYYNKVRTTVSWFTQIQNIPGRRSSTGIESYHLWMAKC